MAQHRLNDQLKEHLRFDDGEEDTSLSFYLTAATNYVRNATGGEDDYLIVLLAGILFEYRVEKNIDQALNALSPFIIQADMARGEEDGT
ncbi:head-tail connector protein [Bacillus safensis]|uniref:head-tail connector protein n=1 Tax=Bacillus safensis TaxID=561879 RepID=UPI002281946C|nr:head-tail connector protein [Bacillus safensis]MCY7541613.1 head-tail connector protein [Bacillus safensis]MCY7551219.1 head-tail connector protein [Bacillus safensis]MCY7645535.1 head-tail connector protein [Bacillus safensis]MCY7654986.1 head-tail connector protein [Bacillus safensis]MEC3710007.1 head-tail connector protein [Bacillus safensis]